MEHYNPLENIDEDVGGDGVVEEKHVGTEDNEDAKRMKFLDSEIKRLTDLNAQNATDPHLKQRRKKQKQLEDSLKQLQAEADGESETVVGEPRVSDDYLEAVNRLQRLAYDDQDNYIKDNNGDEIYGKSMPMSSKNRTYIIQQKVGDKWVLVSNKSGGLPQHTYKYVTSLTKHNVWSVLASLLTTFNLFNSTFANSSLISFSDIAAFIVLSSIKSTGFTATGTGFTFAGFACLVDVANSLS
jgi:hypothetical protein